MNGTERKHFVNSLTASIALDIISKIEADRIPENWDGLELRQYIAERFAREAVELGRKRKGDYKNDVLANNL